MDTLPVETLLHIFEILDIPELLSTIRVNYLCYSVGIAQLFANITFFADPYSGDLTAKSAQLFRQLYLERDVKGAELQRIRLVKNVCLAACPQPRFRVTPQASRTLNTVFFQFLQNRSVQSRLRTFQWRIGCAEEIPRNPLPFPRYLRALECVACQVDATLLFPALERLSLRQLKDTDGEWISRQMAHSKLQYLFLSGFSSADRFTMSRCTTQSNKALENLHYLGLEHVRLDIWPLPPVTRLKELVIRYCTNCSKFYRWCKANLSEVEAFTFVSEQDVRVWALGDFTRMLWSCRNLKSLVLLLAGRATNIPLSWVRPFHLTLETLVLEARLFVITPTMSCKYSLADVRYITTRMPNLRILGLPIDLEQDESHPVRSSLSCWKRS